MLGFRHFFLCFVVLLFIAASCSKSGKRNRIVQQKPHKIEMRQAHDVVKRDSHLDTLSLLISPVDASSRLGITIPISLGKSQCDEQLIARRSYICSYNKDNKCANWSAWKLTKEHADGPFKRRDLHIPNTYLEDGDYLEGKQLLTDWDGITEYDHGHLCPSGDNKWDLSAMKETFFLSNMCVQNRGLNQGPWERLESTCREWAKAFDNLYIICGPIFKSQEHNIIGKNLHVPDSFFKVVLCMSDEPKAIGFVYENIDPEKGDKLEGHAMSIDDVERITSYDFFSGLDDVLENRIEAGFDFTKWKLHR